MTSSVPMNDVSDLIGREAVSELLDTLVDGLHDTGGALIVRGEAGIGKSALLQHARERVRAKGGRVLSTLGVESEVELAFAALHQLLHPIIDLTERLSEAQRGALDAAFGVSGELEPDPFRVALAAFQLVCDAAEPGPLALIVDDAQWIDHSSMGVLTFLARRLESEPVALLAAVRTGYGMLLEEAHLPTLDLDRLSSSAAARLLDQRAPELHPILRARVLSEAAGNPLALVELGRTVANSVGTHERITQIPTSLTARLEQAFASRLHDLPAITRSALLVAAIDSRASLDEIVRCVRSLQAMPVSVSALKPAFEAGLIDILDGDLRFRHPLIRSAVRQAAEPGQLQATYAALATFVADPGPSSRASRREVARRSSMSKLFVRSRCWSATTRRRQPLSRRLVKTSVLSRSCTRGPCSRSADGCGGSAAQLMHVGRCARASNSSIRSALLSGASVRDGSCERQARRLASALLRPATASPPRSCRSRNSPPKGCQTVRSASAFFLSHRTVGGHLYRIFPKLAITGRAQLRNALK